MYTKIVLILLICSVFLGPAIGHSQISGTLVVSDSAQSQTYALAERLSAELKGRSGGRIETSVLHQEAFGQGARGIIDAVQMGAIQFALVPIWAMRNQEPRLALFEHVFLFNNIESVDRFQKKEEFQSIVTTLEERAHLKILGISHRKMSQLAIGGYRNGASIIQSPRDLHGLRLSVSNDLLARQFSALGASPLSMPFGEAYMALQAGGIDIIETSLEGYRADRLNEIANHIALTNHRYYGDLLISNVDFWNYFPEDLRQILMSSSDDIIGEYNSQKIREESSVELLQSIESLGVTISIIDSDQWREEADVINAWHMVSPPEIDNDLRNAAIESNVSYPSWPTVGPPSIRPPRPPALPPDPPESNGPFWNAWFEKDEEPVVDTRLSTNTPYWFVLDLSRLNYQDAQNKEISSPLSTVIAEGLEEEIKTAKERGDRALTVWLRPVLVGANPDAADNNWRGQRMIIKFDRLDTNAGDVQLIQDLRQGTLSLGEFSDMVRAGFIGHSSDNKPMRLQFQTPEKPGCGFLAISIWDKSGKKPLSHLIHRFEIGNTGSENEKCATDKETTGFSGGLQTLMSIISAQQPADFTPISAALHIFEFRNGSGNKIALAVFVKPSESDEKILEVRSWQLKEPLSEYFDNHFYLNYLLAAHSSAPAAESNPYLDAAKDLKERIFSAHDPAQKNAAHDAFNMLRTVANESESKTVLARLVGADGEMLYLPLRLLSAGDEEQRLLDPFPLVQPLPRERYSSTCVDLWSIGLPTTLTKLPETYKQPAATVADTDNPFTPDRDRPWLHALFQTIDHAESYFGNSAPTSSAEGLMLVTHHGNGGLWFNLPTIAEPTTGSILTWSQIVHQYQPGSVAILATCEAAEGSLHNRKVLNQLNRLGIDTIIASPFKVDSDFGAALGQELASMIAQYRDPDLPDTDIKQSLAIGAFFDEAARRAADKLNATHSSTHYRDMFLEFQILGDHGVSLCPSSGGSD